MTARQRFARLFLGVLALSALAVRPAPADTYVAGTTFVASDGTTTVVDFGVVECNPAGASVGGACIPWSGGGGGIKVEDEVNGTNVAFQVCVDNDGNSFCGGIPLIAGCEDDITFSHHDDGTFSNPLGVPSSSFRSGCPGGFPGWVVFLCQGAHASGIPHTHEVTAGTITAAGGGGPSGEFCGSQFVGKPYVHASVPNGCVGLGSMTTDTGLSTTTTTTADYEMEYTIGACADGSAVEMEGTLTGSCFAATGTGTVLDRPFTLTWAGSVMELTPVGMEGAIGTLAVTPDPLDSGSCTSGEHNFIIGGVIGHR